MPDDLPLRAYDSPRREMARSAGRKNERGVSGLPVEAPFLDFLYPPQALALLKRLSSHQWERRNAKRLPDGFVQASRGYASRARGQVAEARASRRAAEKAATPGERSRARYQLKGSGQDERDYTQIAVEGVADTREGAQKARKDKAERGESQEPAKAVMSQLGFGSAISMDDNADHDWSEFADSPADLAEARSRTRVESAPVDAEVFSNDDAFLVDAPDPSADLAEGSVNALERLRSLVSRMRRAEREDPIKQLEPTVRALKLYDSVGSANKEDVRLKTELLRWLALQRNSTADVRCAELYHSLPVECRTLEVYQAALSIFLRRGLHVQAVKLHKEALTHIRNGDQVTKTFFEYAMDENRWQLAMNVEAQYRLQNARKSAGAELFWLHVSETPKLILKAIALSKYIRPLVKARTANEPVRRFCGRFYTEALIQEFQTTNISDEEATFTADGMPQGSIGRLFESVGKLRDDAPPLYERMIHSLLHQKRAAYQYPQIHRVVSYVYLALHKTGRPIPEDLLMALLEQLTKYWGRLRMQRGVHHSVNVGTLLTDWATYHGKISKAALKHVLSWHASRGRQLEFETMMEMYRKDHGSYGDLKEVLGSEIYLHARRIDLPAARAAFEKVVKLTAEHGELPPLICWNTLIHAHSRADSLESAIDALQALVDAGLKPDEFSFHPIMQMLAKRGDVDGVNDLLTQYDVLAQKKREAAFIGSLLTAHVNCDEIEAAEEVLRGAIGEVKKGHIRGSLTGSFNIILAGHALSRDIDATMRTYRWMKTEGIRMNAETYAALIQALTSHRQVNAAYKILRRVMREEEIEPTAFHYALVMVGYVNMGKHDAALEVHKRMRRLNIRPTSSSNAIYLKARALHERADLRKRDSGALQALPLERTVADMRNLLRDSNGYELAAKQPGLGHELGGSEARLPTEYFNFLIYIHGRQRCFEAVKKLQSEFQDAARVAGDADRDMPIQMLAELMSAHLRAEALDNVEECWKLAEAQAYELARSVPVPQIKPFVSPQELEPNLMELQPPPEITDAQEAGFSISEQPALKRESRDTEEPVAPAQAKQALVTDKPSQVPPIKLSPARQHVLSRPLRFYLYALARQGRTADILSTVAKLFGQGYTLDNRTWNAFIELLCRASPPLVLLAFTLTERFLVPHFPGWAPVSRDAPYNPRPSAKVEGLQYIRARYLRPGQLMPQYRTFVLLGSALLRLRRIEATGRRMGRGTLKGMDKYIGTLREVRMQAPKTVFAVQSMPTIDDGLQNKFLKRA